MIACLRLAHNSNDEGLRQTAQSLGLDAAMFESCMAESSPASVVVSRDAAMAKQLGIVSTPSFYFGSRLPDGRVQVSRAIGGSRPLQEYRDALDRAMSGRANGLLRRFLSTGGWAATDQLAAVQRSVLPGTRSASVPSHATIIPAPALYGRRATSIPRLAERMARVF